MSSSTTTTTTKTENTGLDNLLYDRTKYQNKMAEMIPRNESSDYNISRPGKGVVYYISHPHELRADHQVWHYLYLCTLIFAAFISLFIGPVIFGMLAAIGGIGTPIALSVLGGTLGLIFGVLFGVVFAVVCIVALVRALGTGAGWVLDTLIYGGNELLETTKNNIRDLIYEH
ncbi:9577_t:CDS:2 [Diversispora eburnea]|uniref:9577_t:CDS:1 n=1 Tax=Diversispora eburnea TaxID=1213867 RepID=A0A9N8UYI1_9GLOM|nr:9577_t:CDS:2 [Diversispora eburnea]